MGLLKYILSYDTRKNMKKIKAIAEKVVALEEKYSLLTDSELIASTGKLKDRLSKGETLDDILPDAFATAREAAWRVLKMKHYYVQIIGGICLHQGRVAEMKTGEGKTLVATLPAYLNALAGNGVHIVTVNDYLAKRDAEWMGKIYKFLGLTVGVIVPGMSDDLKRKAYACDITYGTNNEIGFDYLRDNLKMNLDSRMQRGLNFAIVDEVDSILIDEARTPLIISGKGEKSSELYYSVNRFVKTLKVEEDFVIDEKEKSVQITEKGGLKAERYFNVENLGDIQNAELNHHIQQALKAHNLFEKDNNYIVQDGEIIIVDEFTGRLMIGRRYSDGLHQAIEAKENVKIRDESITYATITFQNLFRLYKKLSGMTGTAKTEEEEFRSIYRLDVLEIPTNKPMVRKDDNDKIYSTAKGKINAIIEEIAERHKTGQPILVGTVTVEKSEALSKLLVGKGIRHNVLNAKNHEQEAEIVAQAGRLNSVTIATNMAGRGTDILLGGNPEFLAKKKLRAKGISEEDIETASSFISDVPENILAIREEYNEIYNEIKKETDEEKQKVIKAGGLCIIGSERHESRRIDNQLRGRAGRQGDPGYSVFFISLEDDVARLFGGERLKGIYSRFLKEDECMQFKMLSHMIENAQRNVEGQNFAIRKNVLQYDDVMNKQREIIYGERDRLLHGANVHDEIVKLIPEYVEDVFYSCIPREKNHRDWDKEYINKTLENKLLKQGTNFISDERLDKYDDEELLERLIKLTKKQYEEKIVEYKEKEIDYYVIERMFFLKCVDKHWIEHIDNMDQLRRGMSLRAFAQQDPVLAYKKEGSEMFDEMTFTIRQEIIAFLLKVEIKAREEENATKEKSGLVTNSGAKSAYTAKNSDKVGPNDPCPCGSGKKYKKCCGKI